VQGNESVEITTPKLDVTGEYERQKYESQSHGVTVSITLPQFAAAAAIANTALGTVLDKVVPNQAAAGSSGGGKAGIGVSYSQSNSHNNSGQYVMSNISSPKLTINAPSQHIDGAVINDKVINPSNNQDYADSGSSSFGFGVGTSGVNASVGFGDYSFGLGAGSSGLFGAVGVGDFNIGTSFKPGANNRLGLFGGAYGAGISAGVGSLGFDAGASYGPLSIGGTYQDGHLKVGGTAGFWNFDLVDYASKGKPIASELKEQRLQAIDDLSEQITDSGLQAQEIKPLVEQLQEARNLEMLYGTDNATEVSNLKTSAVLYELNEKVASGSSEFDIQRLREAINTLGTLNPSVSSLDAAMKFSDGSELGHGGGGGSMNSAGSGFEDFALPGGFNLFGVAGRPIGSSTKIIREPSITSPVGRLGNELIIKPGTNKPAIINGRQYSGHALDRMQGRGITPSIVEDAILHGTISVGREGSKIYSSPNAKVIINPNGSIKTVIPQSRSN
jgi:hypothetical protein